MKLTQNSLNTFRAYAHALINECNYLTAAAESAQREEYRYRLVCIVDQLSEYTTASSAKVANGKESLVAACIHVINKYKPQSNA